MAINDPYSGTTLFTNKVTQAPFLFLGELSSEEQFRLNYENERWKFYQGDHWNYRRPDGEPQVTMNYLRAFVDKSVAFLMGKPFSIQVIDDAAEKVIKDVLDYVWEDNNKHLLGLDMAQMGGVTGNAYVKVAAETYDPKEDPALYEIYPKGRVRLILLPSGTVFPKFHGHDRDRMVECKIMYRLNIENGDKTETVLYKEIITKDFVRIYIDGTLVEERENPLHEIPIGMIKNLSQAGFSLGRSDMDDLIPLQKEFNFKSTDISDIINYHGAPITIVKGAKVGQLERGARKVWGGLPADSDVYNLELHSDLSASLNYLTLIKTALFEIGYMPEDALKGKEHVSNTSGIALHVKNQPILDLTHRKWVTYGAGIMNINRLILKTARYLEIDELDGEALDSLPPSVRYKTEVKFADPLPKDILIQMQVLAQKIRLGLESRLGALQELGESDPKDKLEEVLAEAKKLQSLIYIDSNVDEALGTNIGGVVQDPIQPRKDD